MIAPRSPPDFPTAAPEPVGIEVPSLDEFLPHPFDLAHQLMARIAVEQTPRESLTDLAMAVPLAPALVGRGAPQPRQSAQRFDVGCHENVAHRGAGACRIP